MDSTLLYISQGSSHKCTFSSLYLFHCLFVTRLSSRVAVLDSRAAGPVALGHALQEEALPRSSRGRPHSTTQGICLKNTYFPT